MKIRQMWHKVTYRQISPPRRLRLGRPSIARVTPGDPESYRRAARDAAALAITTRTEVYDLRDFYYDHYMRGNVPSRPSDARKKAYDHPLVKQAIDDQQFYERLANFYALQTGMHMRSPDPSYPASAS